MPISHLRGEGGSGPNVAALCNGCCHPEAATPPLFLSPYLPSSFSSFARKGLGKAVSFPVVPAINPFQPLHHFSLCPESPPHPLFFRPPTPPSPRQWCLPMLSGAGAESEAGPERDGGAGLQCLSPWYPEQSPLLPQARADPRPYPGLPYPGNPAQVRPLSQSLTSTPPLAEAFLPCSHFILRCFAYGEGDHPGARGVRWWFGEWTLISAVGRFRIYTHICAHMHTYIHMYVSIKGEEGCFSLP